MISINSSNTKGQRSKKEQRGYKTEKNALTRFDGCDIILQWYFEVWLSLVERCVRDAEVASSNLVASIPACWSSGQDDALSRRKPGFDSRSGHKKSKQIMLAFCYILLCYILLSEIFRDCSPSVPYGSSMRFSVSLSTSSRNSSSRPSCPKYSLP